MRAAIYGRRSTEEHQVESLATQRENARAYIERRGWTAIGEPFEDTASRAEFVKRPGLDALLAAVDRREVDVVVMRDDSRLGGDMLRSTIIAQDLADSGVRIVFYSTGETLDLDTGTARLVAVVRGYASEEERRKIASRTREFLELRVRHGLVAGGTVYGYRNVRTEKGVHREIDPAQAEVVRLIYRLYIEGLGVRGIAHELNAQRIPPPRAGKRGTGSWAPSAIRAIVTRPLYSGRVVWGRAHKTYKRGTKVRTGDHEHELVVNEVPELRIIDEATWSAVQDRIRRYEKKTGTKRRGKAPRHLLTGLSRCGLCGGPIHVANGRVSYESVPTYGCGWHRDRGQHVCPNGLRRPVAEVDAAVAGWIQGNVLREEVVLDVLAQLRVELAERAARVDDELPAIEGEVRRLRAEIERLAEAIATSATKPAALVKALDQREERLQALEARARAARAAPSALDLEVRRLERSARTRLAAMREIFDRTPTEARAVIEALVAGPLRFEPTETPVGKRYQITGAIALGGMLSAGPECHAEQPAERGEPMISTGGVPSGTGLVLIPQKRLDFVVVAGLAKVA